MSAMSIEAVLNILQGMSEQLVDGYGFAANLKEENGYAEGYGGMRTVAASAIADIDRLCEQIADSLTDDEEDEESGDQPLRNAAGELI